MNKYVCELFLHEYILFTQIFNKMLKAFEKNIHRSTHYKVIYASSFLVYTL